MKNIIIINIALIAAFTVGLFLGFYKGKVDIYEGLYSKKLTCELQTLMPPVEIK